MLQIKKVEKFGLPSVCYICQRNLDEDPYRFTFSDGTSMLTCDTCGEHLCIEFRIEDTAIKHFGLVKRE